LSYNTVACCFQTVVIYDCPTRSTSPLLCIVFHSERAFYYNARFVIMSISLGSLNERFNEVAMYCANRKVFTSDWNCFSDVRISDIIWEAVQEDTLATVKVWWPNTPSQWHGTCSSLWYTTHLALQAW